MSGTASASADRDASRAPGVSGSSPPPLPARRHRLVAAIRRRLVGRCGIEPDATLVIACSGGADSTALLVAAAVIARRGAGRPSLRPVVGHVHHHLRPEADAEAEMVMELSRRLGLPAHLEHVNPGRCPGNTSGQARLLRYEALGRMAERAGADAIAVAHHAEDQLETILMALGRGSGPEGLAGMDWSAPRPGEGPPQRIVRPLLDISRGECRDLCRAAGVTWCEDPSNLDPARTRTRLRQEVVPVLEEIWPHAATRATGTADLLRAASAALEMVLDARFGPPDRQCWSRADLRELSRPLIVAGLRRAALHALGGETDRLGQRQLHPVADAIIDADRHPRRFAWPAGLEASVSAREVELVRTRGRTK